MRWEYSVFAAIMIFSFGLQQTSLYRRWRKVSGKRKEPGKDSRFLYYLTFFMVFFLLCSLYGGWFFVRYWEDKEKEQMRRIMDGVAPTIAYELKKMGHAGIALDTPDDDPAYLGMISTMADWMKINPLIQSIYTFRKTPRGDIVFILGPETDYDRNGVIEGEEEARVPIGTVYKEDLPEMETALRGQYAFQEKPTEDKWGKSISAFMPIYGNDPAVPEAILGIDFDGETWEKALRHERINAMGLIMGFLVLMDIFYLMFCYYWFDMQKIRQQEREQEIAYLDRLNLIGEVAVNIGHEVRNPMTTVRGFLQWFNSKEAFVQYKEALKLMIEELDRANSIISEFLSLAKNKRVDLKACSLNEVLQAMRAILQSEAQRAGHSLTIELGDVAIFPMDISEIRQLVLNLFRNGLDAMPDGGMITIATYMSNGRACLQISDEGEGIAQQVLANLWTPFLTTKENGTGLGLAVCFRVAEHHKAKIDVTTGAEGTTFIVRFPLDSMTNSL